MLKSKRLLVPIAFFAVLTMLIISNNPYAETERSDRLVSTVARSDLDMVTVGFMLPTVSIRSVSYDGIDYSEVRIPGGISVLPQGDPDLPVIRKFVGIPECDDVSIEYTVTGEIRMQDIRVAPKRERDYKGNLRPLNSVSDIYSTPDAFPKVPVRIHSISRMRGQRIAVIEIYPVQYYPGSNEISVMEDVVVTLKFVNASGEMIKNVGPMQNILDGILENSDRSGLPTSDPSAGRPMLGVTPGTVCWPTGATPALLAQAVSTCGADYLIIMDDELDDDLVEDLADKRAGFNGFNVAIVKMSQLDSSPDTFDTPETIHDFIEDVYDDQSAAHMDDGYLGYVLLVGDAYNEADSIMIPSYYGYGEEHLEASDAYYSFLDGDPDDYIADVFLGRLPVNQITGSEPDLQLENIVNKILGYERDSGSDFRNMMVMGDLSGPIPAPTPEDIRDEIIPSYVETEIYKRMYDPRSDVQFSSDLADTISMNDIWLVGMYGHGNPMYLQHTFLPQHYDYLTNSTCPLFLLSGCAMGYFDYKAGGIFGCLQDPLSEGTIDPCDAMAEALVIQEKGAIGVYAYTRDESGTYATAAYEGFYKALFEENAYSLGEILLYMRYNRFNDASAKALLLFSDPALNIMWEESADDTLDLLVRESELYITGAVEGIHVDNSSSVEVNAVIENVGSEDASNVKVRMWDGPPADPGSSVYDSLIVSSIGAFGDTVQFSCNIGMLPDGLNSVYVEIDPGGYDELTEYNNTAGIDFYCYDEVDGFPIAGIELINDIVTVAEIDPTTEGKETLTYMNGGLVCYGADGDELWKYSGLVHVSSPAVGCVYKDGKPYVVALDNYAGCSSNILVIDGETGYLEQSVPLTGASCQGEGHMLMLTDLITDDDYLEVVISKSLGSKYIEAYSLYLYNSTYQRWSFTISGTTQPVDLAVGDIDGDGDKEVLASVSVNCSPPYYYCNYVYMIEAPDDPGGTAAAGWSQPAALQGMYTCYLALVPDTTSSTGLDVLATGGQSMAQVSRINNDGSVQYSNGQSMTNMPYFTVADLEDDGDLEIIATSMNTLWILDADTGALVDDDSTAVGGTFVSVPLTADIDGDGTLEIAAAYLKDGILKLQIFDEQADLVGDPIIVAASGGEEYNGGELHFAIDDIDGDGTYEAVFMGPDGVLHAFIIGDDAGLKGWTNRYRYATQTNIYEQPVGGTYTKDISLAGDVRVISSAVLQGDAGFIDAGTKIRMGSSTMFQTYKELNVMGSASEPVDFRSAAESPSPGAWSTFVFTNGSSGALSYCIIRDAVYGLMNFEPIELSFVTIDNCQKGIYSFEKIEASDLVISDCTQHGILFGNAYVDYGTTVLDDVEFDNVPIGVQNDHPYMVLEVTMDGDYGTGIVANATTTIQNSTVSNGTGVGIHIKTGVEALITSTTVEYQDDGGIWCEGCAVTSELDHVTTNYNDGYGMKFEDTGLVDVDSCFVQNNEDFGILCDNANPNITWCTIKSNAGGVHCTASSHPRIGYTTIQNNVNGVTTAGNSFPSFGNGSTGGQNIISGNTGFHVVNMNENQTQPVYAQYDYWGSARGPKSTKLYGNIVYTPYLTSAPYTPLGIIADETDGKEDVPSAFLLSSAYPNPFNPSTTIRYDVPEPGGKVRIVIYNVAGKRVKELISRHESPGFHTVQWNAVDDHGRSVSSGIYFLQMTAAEYVHTKKLVLLR